MPACIVRQCGDHLWRRPDLFEVDTQRPVGAAVLQMDMGVLEARQQQPAAGIDDPGPRPRERARIAIIADPDDATLPRRQRPHPRLQRIHGADVGIDDD